MRRDCLLFSKIMRLLRERDAADIVVFGGGIIPDSDTEALKKEGLKEIFTPGASTETIVSWVRANVKPRVI